MGRGRATVWRVCVVVSVFAAAGWAQGRVRRLPVNEYVDKMKAGWIGQMAGVGWGGPTEFKWKGKIIPEDRMPKWKPEMINQFHQDLQQSSTTTDRLQRRIKRHHQRFLDGLFAELFGFGGIFGHVVSPTNSLVGVDILLGQVQEVFP